MQLPTVRSDFDGKFSVRAMLHRCKSVWVTGPFCKLVSGQLSPITKAAHNGQKESAENSERVSIIVKAVGPLLGQQVGGFWFTTHGGSRSRWDYAGEIFPQISLRVTDIPACDAKQETAERYL